MPTETLAAIIDADLSGFQQALTQMTRLVEQQSERAAKGAKQIGDAFQGVEKALTRLEARTGAFAKEMQNANDRAAASTKRLSSDLNAIQTAVTRNTQVTNQYSQALLRVQQDGSRSLQGIRKDLQDLSGTLTKVVGETQRLAQENQRATQTGVSGFGTLQRAVLGLATAYALVKAVGFAQDAVQTALHLDSLRRGIAAAAGSATAGAAELAFLRAETERLGLRFSSTADSYKGLLAAFVAQQRPVEQARVVFQGVTTAMTALGASNDATKGALLAVTQIMSQQKVEAEEVNQIVEHMPVALSALVQALRDVTGNQKLTTREFREMAKEGKITADIMIPFAEELTKRFGKDVVDAAQRAGAEFNRFFNTLEELRDVIGIALLPGLAEMATAISAIVQRFIALDTSAKAFGSSGNVVVEAFRSIKATAESALPAIQGVAEMLRRNAAAGKEAEKLALESQINTKNEFFQAQGVVLTELERQAKRAVELYGEADKRTAAYGARVDEQKAKMAGLRAELDKVVKAYTDINKQLQPPAGAPAPGPITGLKILTPGDPDAEDKKRLTAIRERIALEKSAASEAASAFREEMAAITDLALTHENVNKVIAQATAAGKQAIEERLDVAKETGATEVQIAAARAKALLELDTQVARARKDLASDVADNQREIAEQITDITAGELEKELALRDRKIAELRKRGATEVQLETFYAEATVDAYRKTEGDKIQLLEESGKKRLDLIEKFYERETKAQTDNVARQIEALDKELAQFKGIIPDERLAEARLDGLVDIVNEANGDIEEAQRQSLEEQQQAWEDFANDVADTLGDTIFDVISGGLKDSEDLLERFKDSFFRIISDLSAQALTRQIVIPIAAALGFQPGQKGKGADGFLGGLLGGGAGVNPQGRFPSTTLQGDPQQPGQSPAQTAQALGGIGQALKGFLDRPLFSYTPGAGPSGFSLGAPTTGQTGVSVSQGIAAVAGAIGTGLSVTAVATDFFESQLGRTGAGGRAAQSLGAASGGAVAGAQVGGEVAGPYGALIGLVAGFIIGGVIGALQKVAKKRSIQFTDIEVPRFVEDELGSSLSGAFQVLREETKNARPEQVDRLRTAVTDMANDFLFATEAFIHSLPESVQQVLPDQLNATLTEFEQNLEEKLQVKITSKKGKALDDAIDQFLEQDFPALLNDVFGDFLERAQRFGEVAQGLEEAIRSLEDVREALTRNFRDQRQELEELLFTPAQAYERRRDELENLLAIFEGATSAERIALAPEIQGLISEIAQLAPSSEVLGQDLPLLIGLQEELLGILGEVESASLEAVNTQLDLAQHTLDAFLGNTDILEATRDVFEKELREANSTLKAISDLLEIATNPADLGLTGRARPPIEEYQTGAPFVPRTGLAYLHRGEAVLSPTMASRWRDGGGESSSVYAPHVQVEVHMTGGTAQDGDRLAHRVAEEVGRRLEQQSHYQQSRLDLRTARARELRSTQPRPTGS